MRDRSILSRRHRLFLTAIAAVFPAATTFASTWFGVTTDWNTAGNWSPVAVPNSTTATASFNGSGSATVNISSSVAVQSLTFSNGGGTYFLTSSASQILTGVTSITATSAMQGAVVFNLAAVSTGSLTFPTLSNLTITNSSAVGNIQFGATTVIGSPGGGGVIFQGTGLIIFGGSFATSPNNVVGGITKNGPGQLNYTGSGVSLAGNVTLNGGTTEWDYSAASTAKTNNGASLISDGGTFLIMPNAGTPVIQTFTSTQLVAGHMQISAIGNGAVTLALSAISRSAGATLDVTPTSGSSAFSLSTSTTNTNGLLGTGAAYATTANGTTWATAVSGSIAGLSTYGTNTYASGVNTDVTSSASVAGITTNSLRFNTGNFTLTLSGTNTLQSGGVLETAFAGGATITGGTLTAPTSGELLFHVYGSNGLVVNSSLLSAAGLTKTGSGNLTLGATNNSLTGPININQGNLIVTTPAAVNSASQINFNDDRIGSSLQVFGLFLSNATASITPPIRLSAFSAAGDANTFLNYGSPSTVTLSGVISSGATLTTPLQLFNDPGGFGFNLTNAGNTFTGNLTLTQGSLGITSDGTLGNAANVLNLNSFDTVSGGLILLNSGINIAHTLSLNNGFLRIASNGSDSSIISAPIIGTGGLYKDGTGTLTLTNANSFTGGVSVNAGTLALSSTGSLAGGNSLSVGPSATFIANPTSSFLNVSGLFLNFGTFQANSGSGNLIVNQIATGPSGGSIDLTGSTAYSIKLSGASAAIYVYGTSSTWSSPNNTSAIYNNLGITIPFTIGAGSTLNDGIALAGNYPFQILGGGTLNQTSDAINRASITTPFIVTQGRFRVTNISSNGGVGNLGSGSFTLDGGVLDYAGPTDSTLKSLLVSINGGTIQVESAATALTISPQILASGPLTKSGPGTLILSNSSNLIPSLIVNGGTVSAAADLALGSGSITVNNGATLLYTANATTSRTINLNSSTLQLIPGNTLALNGATITGGFLRGGLFSLSANTVLSGVTTFSSATLSQVGPASLINITNGGTITSNAPLTLSGGSNAPGGIVNINSTVDVTEFTNSGVITLAPGASLTNSLSNLVLGGGSRTFLGNVANHGGTITLAGGTTLEVNGALLVNDGTITGTTNVNYGGTAEGVGSYGTVNVSFGGTFQPGFASSGIVSNGATITALTGSGTIDNTSTGAMTLTLSGSSISSFAGPIQNTAGTTSLAIQGTSSLTLLTSPLANGSQSVNTFTGGLSIASGASVTIGAVGALPNSSAITNDGSLAINATSTAASISGNGSLSIGPGSTLILSPNNLATKQGSLALTPTSTLSLTNNFLILEASNALTKATDISQLAAAVATGKSNGFGITTSPLAANLAIAIIDNAALATPFTTFGGRPVDLNSVLLAPELLGDSNIDGHVDLNDLNTVLNNLGLTTGAWTSGNFDGQATIDLNDLNAVLNHLGTSYAHSSSAEVESLTPASAPTPEPGSLALVVPALLLARRRRRGSRTSRCGIGFCI